ncbi:DUF3048 domain-containing protein [Microlunatus ginsengisoli]|uniref:DUF3048 domain-containing protein n=1 Tax=Microlunatus ginsengisoli TaxID=363863 RepID=A0ABP6ZAN5_9ACTN
MPFAWKRGHTVAAIVAAAVLVGGGTAVAVGLTGDDRPETPLPAAGSASSTPSAQASATTPSPTPMPSPTAADYLTGRKPSDHEVFAVKVENIAAARPQVGLGSADIVFAEEVEGAQTRLVAIYHTTFPRRLGPVRSARSTDVQLLPLFGKPGLVYSGANRNVQGKIDRSSIVPIERSTRDHSRVAPHNVFVNLAGIADAKKVGRARDIGWTFAAADPRWAAAASAPDPKGRVGNDTFSFDYGNGRYVVKWRGQAYVDGDSGAKAMTDNVVVMSVHNHPDGNRDVLGSASVMSDTVGTGKVTVYRDGKKLTGTWTRTSSGAPLTFTGADGKDLPLKPGRTWVLPKG